MTSKNDRRVSGHPGGVVKFAAGLIVGAKARPARWRRPPRCPVMMDSSGKGLGTPDKTAYVAGYSDAMHSSLGKLDNLRVAAALFHWKGRARFSARSRAGWTCQAWRRKK